MLIFRGIGETNPERLYVETKADGLGAPRGQILDTVKDNDSFANSGALPSEGTSQERGALEIVRDGFFVWIGSNWGKASLLILVGLGILFWPLVQFVVFTLWVGDDGYYSHGFLVPILSGIVIYKWWPKLKDIPVDTSKAVLIGIIPMLAALYLARIGFTTGMWSVMSVAFLGTISSAIWLVAGWRWALALALPVLYLIFALPVFGSTIEQNTNQLQLWSTESAYVILKAFGLEPLRENSTVILLNNFSLNVAVPCSGLKLLIALTAFTVFFVLIAKLKLFPNLFLLALVAPLAVFINGLRIALIGVVGNAYGNEAGMTFHDYSGFITLLVCFFILFKTARILGWKD